MTPHDELMALAGRATPGEWRQEHRRTATGGYSTEVFDEAGKAIATLAWHALPTRYEGEVGITSTDREANAAFIAAACNFVRSDAFRAMVRDDWHSVSEKLPADGDVVLCYESRKGNQFVSQFMAEMPGGKPGFMEEFYEKAPTTDGCPGGYGHWPFVTHWRPLPAPPQAIDAAASGAGGVIGVSKVCERCGGTGECFDLYWTCGDPECCGSGSGECPNCNGTGKIGEPPTPPTSEGEK